MSEDQELEYVNCPAPTAQRHNGVRSGRRVKVIVLRVAVVLAVALVVAYVFDGVALFLHMKVRKEALTTTPNTTAMISSTATATTASTTTTSATSGPCRKKLYCDTGWELNGTKCYYFSKNKLSWSQSKEECVKMGGHLVKIDSREEQMFLFDRLKKIMTRSIDKFWIGLTDSETEGVWKWTDGSSLDQSLTFWFKTKNAEPDNWTGDNIEGEDCVRMGEKGAGFDTKCWFDQDCNSSQHYMCEKNANCTK